MSNEDKRKKRTENRKRKIEAFLAVAELNDEETKKFKFQEGVKKPEEKEAAKDVSVKVLDQDKPRATGEEFIQLKQRLRERKKMLKCLPLFRLKSVGQEALINLKRESRVPLFMSDIQALLTYCICGDRAPYYPHRWCTMEKWNRLSNIVCVVVEGLGVNQLEEHKEELGWMHEKLEMMEVISPACYDSHVANDLALIPISARQQMKLIKEYGSLESALEKNESGSTVKALFPVKSDPSKAEAKQQPEPNLKLQLLLNAKQLIMENYPLPLEGIWEKTRDFVFTKDNYIEVHAGSPILSIDCEMCLTEDGMELTRICVVNEHLEVVYHSLVKPEKKILNYLTQYSGITSKLLEGVETNLMMVQTSLREILPEDCILVGQSLNSDLNALKMMHPYVIDTSVIFNITGDRRRKTKLSALSNIFLNKEIQAEGIKGHNPEEDAKAAMSLVLLKLREGYRFGDVLLGGRVPGIHDPEQQQLQHQQQTIQGLDVVIKESYSSSISKAAEKVEKTVALSVSDSCAETYHKLPSFKSQLKLFQTGSSYKELMEKSKTGALEHNLSISHLDLRDTSSKKACRRAEKFCQELYSHTSTNGLFLLILAGSKENNAAAGVTLNKPKFEK